MKNTLLFSLVFFTNLLLAQSDKTIQTAEQAVESYGAIEKIYLHTDRDYYTGGGDIFFKVYLTDAELRQQARSKVAYVDLINPNGKIIQSRTIALKKGRGVGDFKLTSRFVTGQYTIRAYTQYMRNFDAAFFFRKATYIRGVSNLNEKAVMAKNTVDVQFFPEGGDLVVGLTSKIAVKTVDNMGKGIAIKGKIVADDTPTVGNIATNDEGFGIFSLTPEPNRTYTFTGQHGDQKIKVALPAALSEGVVLAINNSSEALIDIEVISKLTNTQGGYLIGQGKGKVFLKQPINESESKLTLPVVDLPQGILHFTYFDHLGQPRAERLVFNHDGIDNFNVDFSTDKTIYQPREKVQLKLDVFDDEGEVLPADLSLTVVENNISNAFNNKDDIQSHLLLSSDLKGKIDHPSVYFKNTEQATKKALDLLLMTHGWRRFKWQDVLKKPKMEQSFSAEQSLSIAGQITKKDKTADPVKAVGYLSELSAELSMLPFETDEKGQFTVENITTIGEKDMVLQAATLNKKQQKVTKNSYALKGDRN
ncbi:MAG: MG2 domain-containing protein, partial [Bacteroidota bacterium]